MGDEVKNAFVSWVRLHSERITSRWSVNDAQYSFMAGAAWAEERAAKRIEARADEIEAEGGSIFAGATVAELRQQAKRLTKGMDIQAVTEHAKKDPGSVGPMMRDSAAIKRDLLMTLEKLDTIRASE